MTPSPEVVAPRTNVIASQPAEWRGHWQSGSELWIYDKSPEIALNSHLHNGNYNEQYLQMTSNAGMRMVRHSLFWLVADTTGDRIYNTAPGSYLYAFREKVNQAKRNNIELVVVVHGMWMNSEAAQRGDPLPWDNATSLADFNQRYAGFLSDMMAMFPEVKFWQVWNEMDAGGWAYPWRKLQGNTENRYVHGQGYATTLRAVYPVIKAAPGRWMVFGGLTGHDWNFLRGVYDQLNATGGKPYPIDMMAFHRYGAHPLAPNGPLSVIHQLTTVMNEYGDSNRPIWLTETGTSGDDYVTAYGWPSGDAGAVFDEHQRSYYETLTGQLYSSPIAKAFGYNLYTLGGAPPTSTGYLPDGRLAMDYSLSLLREDQVTPRPSYNWLLGRAGVSRAAWDFPARTGTFRIGTWGPIPVTQPYVYDNTGMFVLQNVQVNSLTPTPVGFINPILVQPSVVNVGPMYSVYNNQVAGYETEQRYMDRLRIQKLDLPGVADICYQVHQSSYGWRSPVCAGAADPWTGVSGYQLEAVTMTLTANPSWSICYQVFSWGHGWTPWACDGAQAGTTGLARGFGAMRVRIHRKA